jgi:hypothetical protein
MYTFKEEPSRSCLRPIESSLEILVQVEMFEVKFQLLFFYMDYPQSVTLRSDS